MKVLFLGSDPTLFDPASASHARMLEYAKAIGTVHILSRAPKQGTVAYGEGILVLHGMRAPKILLPLLLEKRARALIKTEGIEVVSAQDPFEHGIAAMKAVEGTPAKLHVQIHTDFLSPWFTRGKNDRALTIPAPALNKIRQKLADKVLPKAHGIRVVSQRVKESVQQKYGSTVVEPRVIPIAVSIQTPEPIPLPPHQFTFALIAAGRLEPEKRIEDILYAMARIIVEYPSLGLFIVGEGRRRKQLEQTVQGLGLEGRVVFLGERGTEAPGLMASAQAFIQASAYEGYGRTLIEAALARVPIITTDVGIVGEVFKGYEDVLSAPVADPAALATHIAGLIEDVQARRSLVLEAEKAAREHLALYADQPRLIAEDLARTLTNV